MATRDENGLIVPRKVPNPCLLSAPVRDLNRQIRWNAKTGINVLNNKTELEKALDRQRRLRTEKEKKEEQLEVVLQNPFQKMLADRARRLEEIENRENGEKQKRSGGDDPADQKTSQQLKEMFESQTKSCLGGKASPGAANNRVKQQQPLQLPGSNAGRRTTEEANPMLLLAGQQNKPPQSFMAGRSKSSWELSSVDRAESAADYSKDGGARVDGGGGNNNAWETSSIGTNSKQSSNSSSKSSSPEPESELLRVFAQLKGAKVAPD